MPYNKWQQTLDKHPGKTMADILSDLYAKHGDHKAVARELGITPKGLREWRTFAGCKTIKVARIVCADSQQAER